MRKPLVPVRPVRPYASQFEERIERVYIYECIQSFRGEDDYWEDDDETIEEKTKAGYVFDENTYSWVKPKPIYDVDLGWLLTQIPDGVKPSDIKIEFDYQASSMAYEDHYIKFYYEKTIPARPEEFKALMEKYNEELKVYDVAVEAWKEACRQLEIEETEAKLNRLKGK